MSISNHKGEYTIYFCHIIYSGCATTYEGCELTFLLEDGKVITLKKGKIDYEISQKDLDCMLKSKVRTIRYQYGDNPTNNKFTEAGVSNNKAEKIISLIKCVL